MDIISKRRFLSGIDCLKGGGALFNKVIAPIIIKYLLKNHISCMFCGYFFLIIIIKIAIISIIISSTILTIIGTLVLYFVIRPKCHF